MAGGRILIVDDDATVRRSVARVLEDEGYTVDQARDGQDALNQISSHRPDAILLDVLMPGMNGRQLLDTLQQDAVMRGIPVVVMTAVHAIDADRAVELGASDLVAKPFDIDELLNKIALALYRAEKDGGPPRIDQPGLAEVATGGDAARHQSRGLIITIDDDHHNLARMDEILGERGYTLLSLSRVTDDLPRLARVLDPIAILLDLRVQGGRGMMALRKLRAEAALDRVPVFVFSANPGELVSNEREINALDAAIVRDKDSVEQLLAMVSAPPSSALRQPLPGPREVDVVLGSLPLPRRRN